MNDTKDTPAFDELAGMMKASFPDLRCLRCGHDKLYLVSDDMGAIPGYFSSAIVNSPLMDREHPLLTLACARCGYVEQHLTGVLRKADKPVPTS